MTTQEMKSEKDKAEDAIKKIMKDLRSTVGEDVEVRLSTGIIDSEDNYIHIYLSIR